MSERFEGGWIADALADDAALECGVCWRPYNPAAGDPERGVPAGTPFTHLPANWRCPDCEARREQFLLVAPGASPRKQTTGEADAARLRQLETAYRDADLAMASLPIYNARLSIALVGFRAVEDVLVGALITPWFLNLVRLPRKKGAETRASGAVRAVTFPSGPYPFAAYQLDDVGAFEALSLFSPMLEFEHQDAAILAAGAALEALFTPATPAPRHEAPPTRRTLLVGRRAVQLRD